MKIFKAIAAYTNNSPKKQLTYMHCCDNINIISNETVLNFSNHKYLITVVCCSNCGSKKATSYIKHIKEI